MELKPLMERLLMIMIGILYSCITHAQSLYQIDLIVFAHQKPERTVEIPLIPMNAHAISLKADTNKSGKPYHLLASSRSSLRDEYYLLNHKAPYQVLGHYSWIQPAKNQSSVALPLTKHNGWELQGILNIKQNTYYSFTAEFQASPPSTPLSSFTVSQKQRLKDNVVYYLDNPDLGVVVKIHKLG
jgi:hypothetical protein